MSNSNSKTVLVTGGAGFIGSCFVRYLFEKYPHYRILVLDALTYAGNTKNFPVDINSYTGDQFQFWYGDVRNGGLVENLVSQSDHVVHFAAETHITRSIYDNKLFFETDVLGTQAVANAVLNHMDTVERFIHISTSEVYGTALREKMDEDHPIAPMSPYAAAKAGADRLVYSYMKTYDIPAVIVRPFNNYGPYQHLEKAVSRFVTNCLLGQPVRVHGDGSASRDYLYVEDTCRALDMIMHAKDDQVRGETLNLGSEVHRDMLSIAKDVIAAMGRDESLIEFIGERPGQVLRHTSDCRKIHGILGWEPQISWQQGLEKTIDWYRHHEEWWRSSLWMKTVPIVTQSGKREFH